MGVGGFQVFAGDVQQFHVKVKGRRLLKLAQPRAFFGARCSDKLFLLENTFSYLLFSVPAF